MPYTRYRFKTKSVDDPHPLPQTRMAQMKILVALSLVANATLAILLYRCNKARLKHLWKRCHNMAKLYRILTLTLDENSSECQQIEARVQKFCDIAEEFKHRLYPNRDRSTL